MLVDMKRRGIKVKRFVRLLEQAVIDLLGPARCDAGRAPPASTWTARRSPRSACACARLLLSRPRAQRRHGPLPFHAIDPCGYPGPARDADAGSRLRDCRRTKPASGSPPARRATRQCVNAGEKQKGARKTARIAQDRPCDAAAEAGLDPRARREPELALPRDQADPARAEAAHGVRGSVVPEHRRMLRQGHGDVHDPRRPLHAALPVLRRRARPAAAAGRGRAAPSRRDDRALELDLRRHHERRPRRPARRRRAALRGLHPRGSRSSRRRPASKCWCPISADGSSARSTSSSRRRPT